MASTGSKRIPLIAGRYEVEPVDGEKDLFWFYDYQEQRAEFVRVEFAEEDGKSCAIAQNVKPGKDWYLLVAKEGAWLCECPAAKERRRCYHRTVAEAMRPLDRAGRERLAFARSAGRMATRPQAPCPTGHLRWNRAIAR